VDRQWLYPFYVIAILSLVLLLFGCDGQRAESFSVEIRVENDNGTPLTEATVGVRPCFESGEGVRCSGQLLSENGLCYMFNVCATLKSHLLQRKTPPSSLQA